MQNQTNSVIPAQAGIQVLPPLPVGEGWGEGCKPSNSWIPAFAGMTIQTNPSPYPHLPPKGEGVKNQAFSAFQAAKPAPAAIILILMQNQTNSVIPAQAGIQALPPLPEGEGWGEGCEPSNSWVPAFAGMTIQTKNQAFSAF